MELFDFPLFFFFALASLYDLFKDREVPDSIAYLSLLFTLFSHLSHIFRGDFQPFFPSIALFFISYLLYKKSFLGEGEAYFLPILPLFLRDIYRLLDSLLLSILLVSVHALFLSLPNSKGDWKLLRKAPLFFTILIFPVLVFLSMPFIFIVSFLIFGLLTSFYPIFKKKRTHTVPIEKAVGEITEEGKVLEEKDIYSLSLKSIKTVRIVKHIPYLPSLFLSLLLEMLDGPYFYPLL